MRFLAPVIAVALAAVSAPAVAHDAQAAFDAQMKEIAVVDNLAVVLASERECDLDVSRDAVLAYIEQNVGEGDLSFASGLNGYVDVHKYKISSMSDLELTAHCHQVRRAAEAHGLLASGG